MIVALAGNQNSGKTTLFNQLTGANQRVGNFPGVTVERKEGKIKGAKDATLVDLPGIYSLSPYTKEEIVTRNFILDQNPDVIIDIVDATNIERGLYLSLQLIQLKKPVVIALNMMDELRENGGSIDVIKMQELLGVPVVPISAIKREGMQDLVNKTLTVAEERQLPDVEDFCSGAVHRAIHGVAHLIEDHAARANVPPKFAATKIIEKDEPLLKKLGLTEHEQHTISEVIEVMEEESGHDRKSAIADMLYTYIEDLVKKSVIKPSESIHHKRSISIDNVLTHKYFGLPLFFGIMALIFYLTFGLIGSFLSDRLAEGIEILGNAVAGAMDSAGVNPIAQSLVNDGIFAGVGTVLSFVPMIIVMFFFMSILEDTGYMARVAFMMDRLLRKIGLSGRSFVPMLLGFGCSVPAIMATRTLASERDRKMTIFLTPFMSCTAKLPIYGVFASAFFENYRALIITSLYILGMIIAVLLGLILKKTVYKGNPIPFIMELPNYRLPGLKTVFRLLWDRTWDFIRRAFTVIFIATIVVWFLMTFDLRLNPVEFGEGSMLASIGGFIAPIFTPLGFGNWFTTTSLLTGFMAKETVISTMAVMTGATAANLGTVLGTYFTPLTAYVFLVFTLLYTPCVATISVAKRELNSGFMALVMALGQTTVAWLVAFIIYRIGLLFIG